MAIESCDVDRPSKRIVVTLDYTEIRGLLAIADQVHYSSAFNDISPAQRDAAKRGMASFKIQVLSRGEGKPALSPMDVEVHLSGIVVESLSLVTRRLSFSDYEFLGNDESESADMMAAIDELKSALDDAVWLN